MGWLVGLAMVSVGCGARSAGDSADTQNPDTGSEVPTADSDSGTETTDTGTSLVPIRAQYSDYYFARLIASHEEAEAGFAVSGAGDFDGDGSPDILIGAPHDDRNEGARGGFYIVPTGISGDVLLDETAPLVPYLAGRSEIGSSASGLGDTNGDSFDDVAVGQGGGVFIFCGSSESPQDVNDACSHISPGNNDRFGGALSPMGDTNRDGLTDLLVGARDSDVGSPLGGAAYLFCGPLTGELTLEDAGASFVNTLTGELAGYGVAGDGDINGDGFNDVAMGGPGEVHESSNGGHSHLFYGPSFGTTTTDDASETRAGNYGAGASLSLASDLDGDGYADLIIGTNMRSDCSYPIVEVFSGSASGADLAAGSPDGQILQTEGCPRSAEYHGVGLGDQDGDGDDELAVTQVWGDGASEFFFLFHGPLRGSRDLTEAYLALGPDTDAPAYMATAANAGDLDHDGVDDVILGMPNLGLGGVNAGGAYLFSGAGF